MTDRLCARLPWRSTSGIRSHELERIQTEAIYQRRVFLIRNLGFIRPTEARRISFEEALRFERIHEETYSRFGFELVPVGPGEVHDRISRIKAEVLSSGWGECE